MMPPMPDPERLKESLSRLQEAFQDAADDSTVQVRVAQNLSNVAGDVENSSTAFQDQ